MVWMVLVPLLVSMTAISSKGNADRSANRNGAEIMLGVGVVM